MISGLNRSTGHFGIKSGVDCWQFLHICPDGWRVPNTNLPPIETDDRCWDKAHDEKGNKK